MCPLHSACSTSTAFQYTLVSHNTETHVHAYAVHTLATPGLDAEIKVGIWHQLFWVGPGKQQRVDSTHIFTLRVLIQHTNSHAKGKYQCQRARKERAMAAARVSSTPANT